jgi:hypothetical protein
LLAEEKAWKEMESVMFWKFETIWSQLQAKIIIWIESQEQRRRRVRDFFKIFTSSNS